MRLFLAVSVLFFYTATLAQTQKENVHKDMTTHLKAVENRDLMTLQKTLPSDSIVLFALPQTELTTTARAFLAFHEAWFKADNWTLESEIVHVEAGEKLAMAVVKQTYREPERNGLPYYNKMVTTYDLKWEDGKWKVFKDHMCSIEKSTDKE